MKLTITVENIQIVIESSEKAEVSPKSTESSFEFAYVDNTEANRENDYWRPLIGQKVQIVAKRGDFWDVLPPGSVVPAEAVDSIRFVAQP